MPLTSDGLRRRRRAGFGRPDKDSRPTTPPAAATPQLSSRTFEDLYDIMSPAAAGGGVGAGEAEAPRPPGLPSRASESELGSTSSLKTIKFENTWFGRITGRIGGATGAAGGSPVLVRVGSTHMSVLVLGDGKAERPVARPAPLLRVGSSIFRYGSVKDGVREGQGSPIDSSEPSPIGTPAAGPSANDLTDVAESVM